MENKKRLIDANKLNAVLQNIVEHLAENGDALLAACLLHCQEIVEHQRTIDAVEVVHGKVTEYEADEWYGPIYQCHECGCEMMVREPVGRWEDVPIRPKLCANCGAMFDGERKDNG